MLALVGGAQLFTSNSLIVMAWASRLLGVRSLLRNWALVWVGNLVGAVSAALLVFASGQTRLADSAVGATALAIADLMLSRNLAEAVAAGVLGNGLVCLAVWLSYSARSTTDRVVAVLPPVVALVALNVDHAVGNMYHLTTGLLAVTQGEAAALARSIGVELDYLGVLPALGNLAAVTLGNVLGGGLLVACAYWFVYLRKGERRPG